MSHDATNWAIKQRGISPAMKVVLWHLCDCYNPEFGSFPSQEYLAEQCEVSRSALNEHLKRLEAAGMIAREQRRQRGSVKQDRTHYYFPFEPAFAEKRAEMPCPDSGHGEADAESDFAAPPSPDSGGCRVQNPDSNPVREPVREPLSADAPKRGSKSDDPKRIERDFIAWFAIYKKGDPEYARNAWSALAEEERAACLERTAAYLRWAKATDMTVTAAAVFLKARAWTNVPEHMLAPPEKTRGIARVYGKLWMGTRFAALSRDPSGHLVVTAFDERRIERGEVSRDELLRSKRLEHGWPLVSKMRDMARRHEPFVTSTAILKQVADFRQLHRETDSHVIDAWRRLHERRGWPFVDYLPEWIYFPAITEGRNDIDSAVEDALAAFLSTISSEAGHDDAA